MRKIFLSHPTGNANVRAAASGMANAQILDTFYTSISCFPGTLLDKISNIGPLREFKKRSFDSDLKAYTRDFPFKEFGRMAAGKLGLNHLVEHEAGYFSIDQVYSYQDRQVAKKIDKNKKDWIKGVYAYEDGAELSFLAAKQAGIACLYDLPIGYWRAAKKLLEAELVRWPEWSATMTGFQDSVKKLDKKDKELAMADQIFVASTFTANTLSYYPGKLAPVKVIPYGFPTAIESRDYSSLQSRPLKLLFVGGLSQRKGIADLFAAMEPFKKRVELTIVGRKLGNNCTALDAALARHNWIPSLPHHEILMLMRNHDVLVFPSLFEGFGLVISEAMSQGTPVITTDRTAGPDLITNGENGWLTEAGSVEALIAAIEKLLLNPEQISSAGKAAAETARQRPWNVYGKELTNAILTSFENR